MLVCLFGTPSYPAQQVVLLQELFSTRYFCQEQREAHLLLAESESESFLLKHFQGLAKELGVVRPRPTTRHYSSDDVAGVNLVF